VRKVLHCGAWKKKGKKGTLLAPRKKTSSQEKKKEKGKALLANVPGFGHVYLREKREKNLKAEGHRNQKKRREEKKLAPASYARKAYRAPDGERKKKPKERRPRTGGGGREKKKSQIAVQAKPRTHVPSAEEKSKRVAESPLHAEGKKREGRR